MPDFKPLAASKSSEPLGDINAELRAPGPFDRLLNRWLVLVRAHTIPVHLALAVGLVIVADTLLFSKAAPQTLADGILVEFSIVIASFAVPIILTAASLRLSFQAIFALTADGPPPAAPVLLRFVSEELLQLHDVIGELRTDGLLLSQESVSEWVQRRCFLVAKGRYVAADSCAPSVFLAHYGELMTAHAGFLARLGQFSSVRINVARTEDLVADRLRNPEAFFEYVRWHREHRVSLLHVDMGLAISCARRAKLDIIDWSLWLGEVALSWNYQDLGVRMRLSFVGDHYYARCHRYIQHLLNNAIEFDAIYSPDV